MSRINSSNWSVNDQISAARLQDINEDIDDLYSKGSDRLKVWHVTGLDVEVGAGNYRVGSSEGFYTGATATLSNNVTSYLTLTSVGVLDVSTVGWDADNVRLAIVTTLSGTVTSVVNWRIDAVGGVLGGGSQIASYFMQDIVPALTSMSTALLNSGNTIFIRSFILPAKIVVTKITFNISVFTASGTMNVAVFSEDGLTRHINFTTGTISGTGKITYTISATDLPAGQYYIAFQLASGGSFRADTFNDSTNFITANFIPTGGNSLGGTKTAVSSGTMDTTINPTTLTLAEDSLLVCRFN